MSAAAPAPRGRRGGAFGSDLALQKVEDLLFKILKGGLSMILT